MVAMTVPMVGLLVGWTLVCLALWLLWQWQMMNFYCVWIDGKCIVVKMWYFYEWNLTCVINKLVLCGCILRWNVLLEWRWCTRIIMPSIPFTQIYFEYCIYEQNFTVHGLQAFMNIWVRIYMGCNFNSADTMHSMHMV